MSRFQDNLLLHGERIGIMTNCLLSGGIANVYFQFTLLYFYKMQLRPTARNCRFDGRWPVLNNDSVTALPDLEIFIFVTLYIRAEETIILRST